VPGGKGGTMFVNFMTANQDFVWEFVSKKMLESEGF
jgi:hypothetical protein